MLCQRHYRSCLRASKKKASTSSVIITEVAKGNIDRPVIVSSTPTPASTRPAATQPRPASDKETVIKKSAKLLSLDNIHEMSQKKQAGNDPGNGSDVGPAPMIREFNQENITELWYTYAANIKDTKGGLSVLMGVILPVVTDATITIVCESDTQKSQFESTMIAFKAFIHRHIGFHPHVILEVNRATESASKYYTPQDKLKRLMELNPALRRFQKELGLDLDYD